MHKITLTRLQFKNLYFNHLFIYENINHIFFHNLYDRTTHQNIIINIYAYTNPHNSNNMIQHHPIYLTIYLITNV